MAATITDSMRASRIVPLIQSDDPETAVRVAEALIEAGLSVLEVVLRTEEALNCLEAIVTEFPDAHVGAGTVLSAGQASEVIERGASFIVSPGLDEASVYVAQSERIPIYPGVATPTELQRAWNLDLRVVKFFPAALYGGAAAIKALASVFRDVAFMPTGGVSAKNLQEYLAVPAVLACGGSWLTPIDAIATGSFQRITDLAGEAMASASKLGN